LKELSESKEKETDERINELKIEFKNEMEL